jgi:hypothetical protein
MAFDGDINEIVLTPPQLALVTTKAKFPAFIAGFGSGKTQALIARALVYKFRYPTLNIAYYLPTFDLVKKIAWPRFEEELIRLKYMYVLNKTDAELTIIGCGKVIFRTMDTPTRIIGYEVADSFVDELDTLKEDDARLVWQKIMARNRQKKPDKAPNTIAVGTTPEGFRFVYARWKKSPPSAHYHRIHASTYSNEHNLPRGYIQDLSSEYPAQLVDAYIKGRFVNLTSGAVYPEFSRVKNASKEVVRRSKNGMPGDALHIGMDFNVGKMSAIIFVLRDGIPHAVDEITGVLDTPSMIVEIKKRYGTGHHITVYPDASGDSKNTNDASKSDIQLLYDARFNVLYHPTNPAIRDRVLSMNQMIHTPLKGRRFFVDIDACPDFVEALEKQAYDDKGKPDKTGGFDHAADAGGYFIAYRFPVVGRVVQHVKIGGT